MKNGKFWVGLLAVVALIGVALTYWLGLFVTPPDVIQGQLVRLLYIHPSVAWVAYLAYGVTSVGSILYLWKRTRSLKWDRLAAASAEVGVVFTALTLITGSIWGRPTWHVWWTWDARLTTTALLFLLYLGYLALRKVPAPRDKVAVRASVAGLVAFIDVPIVHQSVVWWKTLHQSATVFNASLSPKVHGEMAWTMLVSFISFTLVYLWMTIKRYQIETNIDEFDNLEVEAAIAERLQEVDELVNSKTSSGTRDADPRDGGSIS
ncbi:MAG: cytochrome c biogenesis protein CcsA [Acidimicrobiaceae bacterium]|nr:cytochrome c biogenesis protein CcsA [Acidimicrobiaceae bacterium]